MTNDDDEPRQVSKIGWQIVCSVVIAVALVAAVWYTTTWARDWSGEPFFMTK
jgi:hypothetical protein